MNDRQHGDLSLTFMSIWIALLALLVALAIFESTEVAVGLWILASTRQPQRACLT